MVEQAWSIWLQRRGRRVGQVRQVNQDILSLSPTVDVIKKITVWGVLAVPEPPLPTPSRAVEAVHSTARDAAAAAFETRILEDAQSSERRPVDRSAKEGVLRSGELMISVPYILE